jgi:hypothetical protein
LVDERAASTHDFTKRRGVLSSTMLAPSSARWALDVEKVWARAEQIDVRRNARTARELTVALPAELTDQENIGLAHQLGQDLVDAYGVAVLVAVHAADAHGDARNQHVHLLMSTRVAGKDGFEAKVRVLDDRTTGPLEARALRVRVAERLNTALERAGHSVRVDPRPLSEQASAAAERGDLDAVAALTREPTKHQGSAATALARRGVATPVVARNARVKAGNAALHIWGANRAEQLRRAIRARVDRLARAPRTIRNQELRKGLGAISILSRAEGADAELLNAQARTMEQGMQAERNAVEAYLDALSKAADVHAINLRGVFEHRRRANERETGAAKPDRRAVEDALAAWHAASAAHDRAKETHERQRRVTAAAQHETAKAWAKEAELDDERPPAWRVLSKRAWAEHRRRQRREAERREAIERDATVASRESAENVEKTRQVERAARRDYAKSRRKARETRPPNEDDVAARLSQKSTHEVFEKTPAFSGRSRRRRPRKRL